ncbi:MAG: DNA mismatch repair endonuclease MutL [Acidobacteria bacterium]|nr:DNA mismatch repair endonuclease MutL [Acidobacteriota bacterium]
MGKVKVLPEILSRKIAAGEIVERPASVVKELIENSLDAGSSRIFLRVAEGGLRLIAVADNGRGMDPEDARLALEHHATSKIQSFEDLARIQTLGFRGEALPSIASVSRLRLRTTDAPDPSFPGTELHVEAGSLQLCQEISWPSGTEVEVQDLFFNVPARRKFLKSVTTELGHINRCFLHYALANPAIEFRFSNQDKLLLEAPAVTSLKERAYQLLGEELVNTLEGIEYEKEGVRVLGLTSLPHQQRSSAVSQFLFVNGRMVRDRVITHAIQLAYRDLMPLGAHPVVVLFVELDPEQIDVNVHPCKTEIRFRDSQPVHSAIFHGIQEALLRSRNGGAARGLELTVQQFEVRTGISADLDPRKPMESFLASPLGRSSGAFFDPAFFRRRSPLNSTHKTIGGGASASFPCGTAETLIANSFEMVAECAQIPETVHLNPLPVVLGQFVESFIVAADREGVLLVDQHVAHERILYEQALSWLQSARLPSVQRLLVPEVIHLNAHQKVYFDAILQELNQSGFEVEAFGGTSVVVKGVPALAARCDLARLIEDVVEYGDSGERCYDVQRLRERIAISVACRSAIKINTPLSLSKMQWMIDELSQCPNPYTCPHGRPIILRLSMEQILRGFQRI